MRWFLYWLGLLSLLVVGVAQAEGTDLQKKVESYFPNSKVEGLTQTPYLGLYEVLVDGEIFYTDEKAEYFFMGHVVDAKRRVSLTSERMQQLRESRRIAIDTLPLEHAIKTVKGNGERSLIVYSDPNCPYCKRLEKELTEVTDITIQTVLYPILKNSMPIAKAIWCADNQQKAWDDFMLESVEPKSKDCEAPLQKLLASGQENRVTGTPTLIFADGSVVPGLIPVEEIERRLNEAKQSSGK